MVSMAGEIAIASKAPAGSPVRLPDGFVWGAATSAYQVEGATTADGRGESIWDRFARRTGAIGDGSSGDTACDHYHRWERDVALMSELGLGAYRFSVAWPRVVPAGRGAVNRAGLDFYERLVDGLLAAGITPLPTLYHWDLPQPLEDEGGWPVRATADAFADYAAVVVGRLGDRVETWMTINEPYVPAYLGYISGEHAPGRTEVEAGLAACHHLLVAHGLAVERIRELAPSARAGIVLNFTPTVPASDDPADVDLADLRDDLENRWFIEALAGREYPPRVVARYGWRGDEIAAGDADLIAQPIDVLGINYYTRQIVRADGTGREPPGPTTAMGWEIHPESFGALLRSIHSRYGFPRYVITENGAAMRDHRRVDGRIDDGDRIDYLRSHLAEVAAAIADGMPIEGYMVWSLLDNFEWAYGYTHRFGIVEVDPATLERIPTASALWYADVARTAVIA
jgi:beta-glucosidase